SSNSIESWAAWWHGTPKDELMSGLVLPQDGEVLSNTGAIFLALQKGLSGTGRVSPNPLVGCVVRSKDDRFLSVGSHLLIGGPHAEVDALKGVAESSIPGAKITITLEPCAHHGKTPPCAEYLARLPIGELRFLVRDPDPRVNGKGESILRNAGIRVIFDHKLEEICQNFIDIFMFNQIKKEVFIGLKAATSKDGVYALSKSSRHWVTGERARAYGHYLRQKYDGILVGPETVRLDNPQLTVRSKFFNGRTPRRVVLDPKGVLGGLWGDLLVSKSEPQKTILILGNQVDPRKYSAVSNQVEIVTLKLLPDGRFDWGDIKTALWSLGLRSLLLEGGAGIWKNALELHQVQKLHWFIGPEKMALLDGALVAPDFPEVSLMQADDYFLGPDHYMERVLKR
ncbi:MAG: bifunctional diaminohydroxyphosphoribosylaminopyrimidine deaminase/5-amino-6-(5-phosphoribosylamino)uracil reductase RibD, partial [Proteobacteria bacterium]|nr:bifunctional diaminohydroxyphosphoribosylaminopyrimidine deaminase/5-amino-6-(5-phosphoribosylamino)uracil reductase RibD [Pseudomonadota bacterium]